MSRTVVAAALALCLLAPYALAEGATLTIGPGAPSYSSAEVAQGQATVTVALADGEGAPVAGARVSLSIIRSPWITNAARQMSLEGATNEDGTATFVVPAGAIVPGTYVLHARSGAAEAMGALTVRAA